MNGPWDDKGTRATGTRERGEQTIHLRKQKQLAGLRARHDAGGRGATASGSGSRGGGAAFVRAGPVAAPSSGQKKYEWKLCTDANCKHVTSTNERHTDPHGDFRADSIDDLPPKRTEIFCPVPGCESGPFPRISNVHPMHINSHKPKKDMTPVEQQQWDAKARQYHESLKKQYPGGEPPAWVKKGNCEYHCPADGCNVVCKSLENLRGHAKRHGDLHVCDKCDGAYSSNTIKAHEKECHTKRFPCALCSKSYAHKKGLVKHYKMNTKTGHNLRSQSEKFKAAMRASRAQRDQPCPQPARGAAAPPVPAAAAAAGAAAHTKARAAPPTGAALRVQQHQELVAGLLWLDAWLAEFAAAAAPPTAVCDETMHRDGSSSGGGAEPTAVCEETMFRDGNRSSSAGSSDGADRGGQHGHWCLFGQDDGPTPAAVGDGGQALWAPGMTTATAATTTITTAEAKAAAATPPTPAA